MVILGLSLGSLILLFSEVCLSSLGLPGGIATLIAVGSLAPSLISLILVVLVAFLAAVLGDIIAYEIGRKISKPLLGKLREFNFFKKNEKKAIKLLDKYGFWIIFSSRFIFTNLCAIISYVSGLEEYPRKKLILAVVLGELLYAIIYALIGFAIGEISSSFLGILGNGVLIIILGLLTLYLGRFLIRRGKNKTK